MKIKESIILDQKVYEKKLKNGLHVILVPDKKYNNTFVTYSTKFGSLDSEFKINGKMVKVPLGVAHFLEHKMFEIEDGTDAFEYFHERGAECNANTSHTKTTYLFSGINKFEENLEFLLSYVEEPYFTDENVEKEKGIIEQEIMMYRNRPYENIYNGLFKNLFINHPYKYPIIGTKESVYSITKEDLYACYNTFYHPSNMFIVITGNIDLESTLKLIEEHEEKRKLGEAPTIVRKEFDEPDEVVKSNETMELDVTVPKFALSYKINVENIKKMSPSDLYFIMFQIFQIKLGSTNLFSEKLMKKGLIHRNFDIDITKANKHFILTIDNESENVDEVIKLLKEELKDLVITEEEFNRRKKIEISSLLFNSDSIVKINQLIMNSIIEYNDIHKDPLGRIKKFTMDDVNYIIDNIKLDTTSTFTVIPNKK